MFRNMNIKKISLWLFIIMVLSFTLAATIFFQTGGYDKSVVHQNINDTKSYNLDGIDEIDVSAVSADIKITPTNTNEVTAHLYGNGAARNVKKLPKLTGRIVGNKIIIKVEEPLSIGFNFNFNRSLKLDIGIPESYKNDLDVSTTSGETSVGGYELNYFNFHTVSGDFRGEGLNTKNTKLGSVSGELSLDRFSGDLRTRTVSGGVYINYANFNNNIDVKTTSGETKIELPESAEFYVEFKTTSGDDHIDFPLTSDENHRRRGISGTVGSSKNKIYVSSVSGDLRITK